jgi:hypothetical protein
VYVFSLREEMGLKKEWSIGHIIQHSPLKWQQVVDEIRTGLFSKIKEMAGE